MHENKRSKRFLNACRGEPVDITPVWLMRQAGRYMREYRLLRKKHSFWTLCKTPELAVEVTLQPVDALGVDAAILFSDILVPVSAMGADIEFTEGKGPVFDKPVRDEAAIDSLKVIEPADIDFVCQAIRTLCRELEGRVPLIGFSGAPFTLASYLVEGGGSRYFAEIKALMFKEPELYRRLMDKLSDVVIVYLKAQIEAGAQVVQLFESWASAVGPADYERYVFPYSQRVLDSVSGLGAPVIHFANGAGTYLDKIAAAGGDVIGIDWHIRLDEAWTAIGKDKAIQGNLDPVALLAGPAEIEKRVRDVLEQAGSRPGHIFNLGHGILPQTPVENAKHFVDCVHRLSTR
ncbi:MAG: uroporphyrinogen decarboxylase [Actinomycetota bacterium]